MRNFSAVSGGVQFLCDRFSVRFFRNLTVTQNCVEIEQTRKMPDRPNAIPIIIQYCSPIITCVRWNNDRT